MNKQELKAKFTDAYNLIVDSEDTDKMEVLGQVVKEQMNWFINNKPDMAEDFIDRLCSVNWNNYITYKEAPIIVGNMNPKPLWSLSQIEEALSDNDLPEQEYPYYNKYALLVTLAMKASDHSESLLKVVSDKNQLFKVIYDLAIDVLKDKDGVFNIRKYFKLI